jgi:hypothetical protein
MSEETYINLRRVQVRMRDNAAKKGLWKQMSEAIEQIVKLDNEIAASRKSK